MGAIAYLRKRKGKMYAVFECEHCGRENAIPIKMFIDAYRVGDGEIYCKYCGKKNTFISLDEKIKRRLQK